MEIVISVIISYFFYSFSCMVKDFSEPITNKPQYMRNIKTWQVVSVFLFRPILDIIFTKRRTKTIIILLILSFLICSLL
jgi:hypothetical protein